MAGGVAIGGGAPITVLGQWQNWYSVRLGNLVGWASADYITLV